MKKLQIAVVAVVAVASIFSACGGGSDAGAWTHTLEANGSPEPIGTFEAVDYVPGQVARLVLMADGAAHLEVAQICQGLRCEPKVIDSLFTRTEIQAVKHLDFIDVDGAVLYSFDYRYNGETLEVLGEGFTGWQRLIPAPAWCATATHCEQQWIPVQTCVGAWTCAESACQFQCRKGRTLGWP